MKFLLQGFLTVLLLCGSLATTGWAQITRNQPLTITASSYDDVSVGSSVSVRVYGEAPDMQNLQSQAENILRARGYRISQTEADLVVGVELTEQLTSTVIRGIQPRPEDRGEITARATEPQNPDEVLGETARNRPRVGRANPTLVMTLSINERVGGRRLWQGRATTSSPSDSRSQVVSKMIPPLTDSIGQTVRVKTVTLFIN